MKTRRPSKLSLTKPSTSVSWGSWMKQRRKSNKRWSVSTYKLSKAAKKTFATTSIARIMYMPRMNFKNSITTKSFWRISWSWSRLEMSQTWSAQTPSRSLKKMWKLFPIMTSWRLLKMSTSSPALSSTRAIRWPAVTQFNGVQLICLLTTSFWRESTVFLKLTNLSTSLEIYSKFLNWTWRRMLLLTTRSPPSEDSFFCW